MRNYLNLFFRDGTVKPLTQTEVATLSANFKELHKIDHKTGKPNKIQLFYTLVRDFSDVRTQELVLDQAWYVLITCFHESGIFYLQLFFREKNRLFKTVTYVYWHFII